MCVCYRYIISLYAFLFGNVTRHQLNDKKLSKLYTNN